MILHTIIIFTLFIGVFSTDPDTVSERLSLKPLGKGDWLVVLNLSIKSKNAHFLSNCADNKPFLMDALPIDVAKLYIKSNAEWFESTQGFGEWKHSVWGDNPNEYVQNGLSLMASFPGNDKHTAYSNFETLCYGLWGITGSMFTNLIHENSFIHDVTDLVAKNKDSELDSTVFVSSDSDDNLCADNLFKWRFLLPCVARNGLFSILADERLFTRSSYRGLTLRLERKNDQLLFRARIEFIVQKQKIPKGIWGFYPGGTSPKKCNAIDSSKVEFLVPKGFVEGDLLFDFSDPYNTSSIEETFVKVLEATRSEYKPSSSERDMAFQVSELDSLYLKVLKRVQSSLLISVENLSDKDKNVTLQQPLPFWLNPLIHTLEIVVEPLDGDGTNVSYSCSSYGCFDKNLERLGSSRYGLIGKCFTKYILQYLKSHKDGKYAPLVIYNVSPSWTRLGTTIMLPPKSKLSLSVELLKDNITFESIHVSTHRGQLIPSAILMELNDIDSPNLASLSATVRSEYRVHIMNPFFSHIVLPDTTMVFNAMAGAGVIMALMFGFVFNAVARDWDRLFKLCN